MESAPPPKWDGIWLSPSQFLQRGEELVEKAESNSNPIHLLHAALETRYCIERLFMGYLSAISFSNTDKYPKLWHAEDLKRVILVERPDFIDRLRFYRLWQQAFGMYRPFEVPNFDRICEIYGKLGNYLHLPLRYRFSLVPDNIIAELHNLLKDSLAELRKHCYDDLPPMPMNPRLEQFLERMKTEKLSNEAVIDLIKPQSAVKK